MSIDFAGFTPGGSLTGGLVIGAAAAVLVLFNGRIAGISGILGGLLGPAAGRRGMADRFSCGAGQCLCARKLVRTTACSGHSGRLERNTDRGFSGWSRYALCEWLYKRPWRLRDLAWFDPFARRHGDIHGKWFFDRVRDPTSTGSLRWFGLPH
ncbi:hypothetical protein GGD41_007208 [Paraburkholderia bryophila]|uniref:Uncharacterized protein n=1 Tax=Paraburkholderia bryophila TaxID=420952 RepID=A0A7Y9WGJ2_9BURK|nr:hypothetical protein [Paraburkholderia bryophila]